MKNYRWSKHCAICNQFITKDKEHICTANKRYKDGLYHCSKCHQYLSKESFNKDVAKKYGIMNKCKECRKLRRIWKEEGV
jgi:hypothetical protein